MCWADKTPVNFAVDQQDIALMKALVIHRAQATAQNLVHTIAEGNHHVLKALLANLESVNLNEHFQDQVA